MITPAFVQLISVEGVKILPEIRVLCGGICMFSQIYGNLNRQTKGMHLLLALLKEEFAYLTERRMDDVTSMEFSIHELIRQLHRERHEVIRALQGVRVTEYARMLPPEEKEQMLALARELDGVEQACARQSTQNTELSLALLDQGQELLDFFYSNAVPEQADTYNPRGAMDKQRPSAALLSGRC